MTAYSKWKQASSSRHLSWQFTFFNNFYQKEAYHLQNSIQVVSTMDDGIIIITSHDNEYVNGWGSKSPLRIFKISKF